MALNGYFGRPGSGKSYSVVEYVIIPALQKGRHVVTNIPLEDELLVQVYGGKVTQLPLDALEEEDLAALLPHGCVAVLDEVWRRWPSGQKVSAASQSDLQLLKEHRHRVDTEGNAMQVVLVTQDPGDLAAWVRKLIAHSFHMNKLEEIGAAKKFSIKVYKGCPVGERIPAKYLIRDAIGTYRPEVYQYYRSATQSQAMGLNVGDERALDKRFNIWSSGSMLTIIVFVFCAVPLGLWSMSYFFGMADRAKEKSRVTQPAALRLEAPELAPLPPEVTGEPSLQQSQLGQPVESSANAEPLPSGLWRLVGYIKRKDSDAPKDPAVWDSVSGYGGHVSRAGDATRWQGDQAILSSLSGLRTVPLDGCVQYPNSVHYYCDLDGERVTPWSGQQGLSESVGNRPMESARTSVGAERRDAPTLARAGS